MRTYSEDMSRWSSVLAHRTYRSLFAAQVIALLGTGLATVALSLLAFDVAPDRSGEVVGTALTIKMVAYVALAPIVSAAVARLDPRTVLVGADVVRAAIAFSLPWVDQVWQIYVLIFVLQAASATFTPAFQAVIPAVLPDEEDYTRALSLSRLAYDLESVASPILAAGMLLVVSFHGLFAGTGLGFVASALLVLTSGLAAGPSGADASFLSRTTEGLRLFLRDRVLRGIVALDLAVAAAMALVLVNSVVAVRQDLGLGETAVAVTLGAFGAGSMLSAISVPRLVARTTDRRIMLAGGIGTVAALLVSTAVTDAVTWPALLAAWAALGVSTSLVLTPAGRVITRAVDESARPAAFAAHFSLSHAFFLVTYPLAGWVGARHGVATSAGVLAALAAVAVALALAGWRRVDRHRPSSVAPSSR